MVFCVPAAPRVFGTKGLVGKLLGLLSTTRESDTVRTYDSNNVTRSRQYQKFDDYGNNMAVPLATLPVFDDSRKPPGTQDFVEALPPHDGAILRTTRVEINDEYLGDNSYGRQHWGGHGRNHV